MSVACLRRAVRTGLAGHRAVLPDLRRPRRRAAAAGDGPRRPDDLVGPGAVLELAEAGFFVVRYDNRDTGRSSRVEGRVTRRALVQAFLGRGGARAVHARRHGRRRVRADGPPRLGQRPRRRGLDGRHDRADDGHRAAAPGAVDDLDHVHARPPHRRLAAPLAAADADRPSARPAAAAYVESSAQAVEGDRLTGVPAGRRARSREPGRGDLRPGRLGQRRDAPDAGDPDPAQPLARTAPRCGCRPPSCTARPTRWCTSPAAGPRPRAIPGAELLVIDGMGHDMPAELFGTFTDLIRRTADRAGKLPARSDSFCLALGADPVPGAGVEDVHAAADRWSRGSRRPCGRRHGQLTRTMMLLGVPSTPLVP